MKTEWNMEDEEEQRTANQRQDKPEIPKKTTKQKKMNGTKKNWYPFART